MYFVYHEMDITTFIDAMEDCFKAAEGDSNLKRIQENRGLSQIELAEQSGINVRNIQMYEQRVNSIVKHNHIYSISYLVFLVVILRTYLKTL